MQRWRERLPYWIPALLWMAVIFTASSDQASFGRSSRIIGPVVRWLLPDLSEESVHAAVVLVRKCAHVAEYAILAMLVWFGLRRPKRGESRAWTWREPGIAMLVVAVYAASDELHQALVPSRHGVLTDVGIDILGGIAGLFAVWLSGRLRKAW